MSSFVSAASATAIATRPAAGQCLHQPHRMLAIVPEDDLREVISTGLEVTTDWDATVASSELEGLQLAEATPPHALLLNQAADGAQLPRLAELAEFVRLHQIPVILMVDRVRLADIHHYDNLGFAGIIAKPFDCVQLATQIANFLGWSI